MLNKILLRKIKFPLSLRGAFSFCHSRESGNPSSLSLRGAKQRSNLNGFSLIELMVALAILGIAALGIFQAYTTGFQAMADSKDRTVATNIAQKKLEEVKNSVSVAYPYYSIGSQELNGKTFTIIVVTNTKKENLEQVIVTVSWKNRNEIEKNVQLETLVYDLKTIIVDEPDVDQIHLSADPTEITCCVVGEVSTITAELFNLAGDRVPSGTPVSFDVNNGSVNPEFVLTDTIGKATTQLTLDGKNTANVTASSGTISSIEPYPHGDGAALQITCKPKTNKIVLSASPSAIIPDTPEKRSFSTITATVIDTCGDVVSGSSDQVNITFVTDKGYFNDSATLLEITITTVNGVATVNLYMETSGEVATVTGTITPVPAEGDPISDSTTVICTDFSITVTASPTSIYPKEADDNNTSIITAVLTQSVGTVADGELIIFTTDKGKFVETGEKTAEIGTSGGNAVVTLYDLKGGEIATITGSYEISVGNNISDTVTVQCSEYVISIVANPDKVIPSGPSTITATLTNYEGKPAKDKRVDFYADEGILSDTSVYTDSNGIAVTTLTLNTVGEIANVSATFGFASDIVTVECIEFILVLTAVPTSITPGESSEITALLTNYPGTPQSDKTITFTTDNGTFTETSSTTATDDTNTSGEATVHLTLNTSGTTAVVTATYGAAEATVSVQCSETYISLNNNISFWSYYGNLASYSIEFDLFLHGGPLVIDKVKIEWETDHGSPSRYRNIWIEIPPGSNRTQIFTGGFSNNAIIVTLNSNSPYTIPANRNFRILIYFNNSIRDRHIIFTLNPDDPHAENYQVEFGTPE